MSSPDDLRAQAKALYDQARRIDNADERLPYVLRALELEIDADALEREQSAIPAPHLIAQPRGGGDRESA